MQLELTSVSNRARRPIAAISCPFSYCFLGVFLAVKFLGLLGCFLLFVPGFLRVRKVREILVVFEVFLGFFFEKNNPVLPFHSVFFPCFFDRFSLLFQGF